MSFKEDLTRNQLELFEQHLDSLMSQTYDDFEVYYLTTSVRNFKGSYKNGVFIDNTIEYKESMRAIRTESVSGLYFTVDPRRLYSDIEVRLDYDDTVSPDFVEDIVDQYHKSKEDTFVLSYQPIIIDTKTGDKYNHPSKYSEDCPSMCCALIQKGEKTKGVYDRPHNYMAKHVGKCIVRPAGLYFLKVHGENTLSTLPGKQYLIK